VLGAVAAVSVVGCTLAIVSAAMASFAALPVASMVAAAAALGGFAYLKWDDIKNAVIQLPGIVTNFVGSLAHNIIDGVKMIPTMVGGVITEVFKSIGNSIINESRDLKNYLLPSWLGGAPGTGQQSAPPSLPDGEKHSSLVPPARSSVVNLTANINMDARRLAQVVTSQMVASATYPTSASGADGRGQWLGPSAYATEQG
jgi:hypothetical protein